jgi:hypothetical protein
VLSQQAWPSWLLARVRTVASKAIAAVVYAWQLLGSNACSYIWLLYLTTLLEARLWLVLFLLQGHRHRLQVSAHCYDQRIAGT